MTVAGTGRGLAWRRRRAVAFVAAAALLVGVTSVVAQAAGAGYDAGQAVAGASAAPTALLDVGPTPADRDVTFELVLAVPGHALMQAYAASVGDPRSPDYRHFLTADEIGARFGLSDPDLGRVAAWATGHGVAVGVPAPQRIAVAATASAATVERLFGVGLRDYTDAAGRTLHAPTVAPRVPADLAGLVTAVDGLDERPSERPAHAGLIAAGPPGGMTPAIIDRVYELEGLRAAGLHGEGQTVAIVSLDTFDPGDVTAFDRLAGTSGPPVERIAVNGGVDSPGDGQGEVSLDIDVLRAVAPKAQILDYEAPNKSGAIATVLDRIVSDGRTDIVSISWGSCELSRSTAAMARLASSMAAAASAGISVFVASGDHGAYDCIDNDRTDQRLSVDSPASDVNAIAVGGTFVSMLEDGTYIDEVAWEEPLTAWAPGGGLSTVYQRPAWQTGGGVDNARSNGKRQVPDVAAAADPASGFLSVTQGDDGSGGGTSAASPFWAGFMVLVRQLAQGEGIDGLGPIGPTLYGVAAAQAPGTVFHDVTRGGNLLDDASAGWDYATGLGTPRGTPLARAIVDHLKAAR